jgi:hypothetical protein
MLYDSFGRRIRKPHLYGFAHVPAVEPRRPPKEDGLADAIGFSVEISTDDDDDEKEEITICQQQQGPSNTGS